MLRSFFYKVKELKALPGFLGHELARRRDAIILVHDKLLTDLAKLHAVKGYNGVGVQLGMSTDEVGQRGRYRGSHTTGKRSVDSESDQSSYMMQEEFQEQLDAIIIGLESLEHSDK